ncbi:unnamed protein product [Amoebophrya sp. A25]|nr:unnamed protein product [Amoebophrya sp. A25]|eukprot:GSA25T00008226001.1
MAAIAGADTEKDGEQPYGEQMPPVQCNKAYKNLDFLNTPAARNIRIQCEFQEPGVRLLEEEVHNVVMFFGSARAKSREEFEKALERAIPGSPEREKLMKGEFLVKYYEGIRTLTEKFSDWNHQRVHEGTGSRYVVATGGGPGMMQAANEGAYRAQAPSVGFGISLPFEAGLNPYVSPSLAFEFHYFFTRKFWMAYKICGLVCAPGGFGTLDELFEILTLKQTGRIKRPIPIILFGKSYWEKIINFQAMCDHGMISQDDVDSLFLTDDPDDALRFLCQSIEEVEQEHNELGSPFLAPMRDAQGGYLHDARGRVRRSRDAPEFELQGAQGMAGQARSPETSPGGENANNGKAAGVPDSFLAKKNAKPKAEKPSESVI